MATHLDMISTGKEDLREWVTYRRTILCLKDHVKGNAVDNFRPISRLPPRWKLLKGVIAEKKGTNTQRKTTCYQRNN